MNGCPKCGYEESMAKQPSPLPELVERLHHTVGWVEYMNFTVDLLEKESFFFFYHVLRISHFRIYFTVSAIIYVTLL